MKTSTVIASLASVAAVSAQRPSNTSICDYYTTALLKENNATNQQTLLTLLVNTAVIGNYTQPNHAPVTGILNKGTYMGQEVNLLPYFTGALASSNRGGSSGVSINFLDDGGAVPLMINKAANGTSSNQYKLLTHLYQYFAYLTGCSQFSNTTGTYAGQTSQYAVHKYMALNSSEVGYFISQVGASAKSFGVTDDDITVVANALTNAFDKRCAPAAAIPATASPALQAICVASDCAIADNSTCAAYAAVVTPSPAPSSSATGAPSGSGTGSTPSSTSTPAGKGAASASFVPIISAVGFGVLGMVVYML